MRNVTFLLLLLLFPIAADPAAAEETDPLAAVQARFSGKVEEFAGRRIRLTYDCTDPEAFGDFVRVNPFLSPPSGDFMPGKGGLLGRGTGAFCHKGVFEADVHVAVTFRAEKPEDVGVVLIQPGMTDQFLLFAVADTYFSAKDGHAPRTHMITVLGAQDTDGLPGDTLFRYLRRSMEPKLAANATVEMEVFKAGAKNRMVIADRTMDAEDRYGEFPKVQPGLYVLKSEMMVTKLEISGKLTADWLKSAGVPFDPSEDDGRKPGLGPAEGKPAPEAGGGGGRGGFGRGGGGRGPRPVGSDSAAGQLIRKLSDPEVAEKERKEAADGLSKDNVTYDDLLDLIQALYSEDLLTRTLAIKALKKTTGKTLGYHPKASETDRKKAIREWFKYRRVIKERFE